MPKRYIAALDAAEKRLEESEMYVEHVLTVNTEYKRQAIKYSNEADRLLTALKDMRYNVSKCHFCKRNQYISDKLFNIPML